MAKSDKFWSMHSDISRLVFDLKSEIIVREGKYREEVIPGSDFGSGPCSFDKVWDYETIVEQEEIREPDIKKREDARKKLIEMYENPPVPIAKDLAGRALTENNIGNYPYSNLRLYVSGFDFIYLAKGIAAIAAASGFWYMIYKYLSR